MTDTDVNIDDLPVLEFDAAMPDAGAREGETASMTVTVATVIAIIF